MTAQYELSSITGKVFDDFNNHGLSKIGETALAAHYGVPIDATNSRMYDTRETHRGTTSPGFTSLCNYELASTWYEQCLRVRTRFYQPRRRRPMITAQSVRPASGRNSGVFKLRRQPFRGCTSTAKRSRTNVGENAMRSGDADNFGNAPHLKLLHDGRPPHLDSAFGDG